MFRHTPSWTSLPIDTFQAARRQRRARLLFAALLLLSAPALASDSDFDEDGVANELDWCPQSTDLAGPVPTVALCEGCMGDDQTLHGCNASDVLACRPGPNNHEYEGGLKPNTQQTFEQQKGWARKCVCDTSVDTDADGAPDCTDLCPSDASKQLPGQCGCGTPDIDSDGDGSLDCEDACPADPEKQVPGVCGCGESDSDTDGDATPDCNDGCPDDPGKALPGVCGCGVSEADSDGDGSPDCNDLCAFDPDKQDPGVCGCNVPDTDLDGDGLPDCNGETGTIEAGVDLTLAAPGGSFTAPADALPAGLRVTLSSREHDLFPDLPSNPGETLVGPVLVLEFSQAAASAKLPLLLTLEVPAPAPAYFHARLRTRGVIPLDGSEEPGWLAEIGRFDPDTSTLSFPIFGTADQIAVVLVERTDVAAPIAASRVIRRLGEFWRWFAGWEGPVPAAHAQVPTTDGVQAVWNERGWAVVCAPGEFTIFDPGCDPSLPGFLPPLVAQAMLDADSTLTAQRFAEGVVQVVTEADLLRSGLVFAADAGGRTGVLNPEFMLVHLRHEAYFSNRGDHLSTTGRLNIRRPEAPFTPANRGTAIHELMHAVQAFRMPHVWADWIVEGTATAVMPAFLGLDPLAFPMPTRNVRDWGYALWLYSNAGDTDRLQYEVGEFWLHARDGDLDYLNDVFDLLGAAFPEGWDCSGDECVFLGLETGGTPSSWVAVDAVLGPAGLPGTHPLADAYLSLLSTRNGQPAYPHCDAIVCESGGLCPEFDSVFKLQPQFHPLSGECVDMQILDDRCPGGPWDLILESDSPDDIRLLIAGTDSPANTPVEVSESTLRLWPVHLELELVPPGLNAPVLRVDRSDEPLCGNGIKECDEQCDDGNATTGDGCSASCRFEGVACTSSGYSRCGTRPGPDNLAPIPFCAFMAFEPDPGCVIITETDRPPVGDREFVGEGTNANGCALPAPPYCPDGEYRCMGVSQSDCPPIGEGNCTPSACTLAACCPDGNSCLLLDGEVTCAPRCAPGPGGGNTAACTLP